MHKVSSNTESEAPAVARWAALVGYAKRNVLRWRLTVSAVGESLVFKRQIISDCGCKGDELRSTVVLRHFFSAVYFLLNSVENRRQSGKVR